MINVDLQQLIQALDAETRRDLERSAERCVARGGSKILVEDLLLGLLERPNGLLRALQDADVDAGELSAALQSRVEHSASRNPVFARNWCSGCKTRCWWPTSNWARPRWKTPR
jgi:type VI secretion system protein VasG